MVLPILFTALILDLGDVLLTWSPDTKTNVTASILKTMVSSGIWMDYERGHISEHDCYARLAVEFSISKEEIASAFRQARDSLRIDQQLTASIQDLKTMVGGDLQVYALTNISIPDYNSLRRLPFEWSTFDAVFPSGLLGERKPDRAVYDRVVTGTGIDPRSTVFVDDKAENVEAARAVGMYGIVFTRANELSTALCDLFMSPLQRAIRFMRKHAGSFETEVEDGRAYMDNFSQLLILELTNDESLVTLPERPLLWNFFQGKELTDGFPDDLDVTALAYTVLPQDPQSVFKVTEEMLKYTDEQGIFLSYFDPARQRIDPSVNVNVLTLFLRKGAGGPELSTAVDYVLDVLANHRYLGGSRYYCSPEMYLYFMSRLLDSDGAIRARAMPVFVERVRERIGVPADPLDLAMRVVLCCKLGIADAIDSCALLAAQHQDGGWGIGWLYKYGKSGIRIGNRGVVAAFAIRAIQMAGQQVPGLS